MKPCNGKYIKAWVKRDVGEEFGRRVHGRMEARNLSASGLAQAIGVEPGNVLKWMKGVTTPRWYYIRRLADALGCTVDWLVTGEEGEA